MFPNVNVYKSSLCYCHLIYSFERLICSSRIYACPKLHCSDLSGDFVCNFCMT